MRYLLSGVIGLFFLQGAFAQGQMLHLNTGLNISTSNAEEVAGLTNSPRFGYALGAGYEMMFSPVFSVRAGLGIETRGINSEFSMIVLGTTIEAKTETKLMYLQIPVLFTGKMKAGPGEVSGFAGPSFGYLASASVDVDGTEADIENIKSYDFGIEAGVGYSIPVGHGFINIRPSYTLGMVNIGEDDDTTPEDESAQDSANRNFQLAVGYSFTL